MSIGDVPTICPCVCVCSCMFFQKQTLQAPFFACFFCRPVGRSWWKNSEENFFFHLGGETVHLCKDSPLPARWPPTDCIRRWKMSPGRRKKQRSTDRLWWAADNAGETRGHKHNRPITFHKWLLRVISGIENQIENLTNLPFLLRVTHLVFFQATFLAFYHVTDSAPLYKSI